VSDFFSSSSSKSASSTTSSSSASSSAQSSSNMSRITQLLVFPFAEIRQALKKGDIYGPPISQTLLEEPSVVLAAQLECEIIALVETAMAVQSDSAYAALNNRKSSTAASNRGVLLSAQHLQVALRRDPKFLPLSSDTNDTKQLMSVLDEFLDQGLADVLQIKLPASLAQKQEQFGDTAGDANEGGVASGISATQNKWSRRRDDVITDVEFSSLLKRIHPGYFFGSDALMLLTALMREILTIFASKMIKVGALRVAENVDDLASCIGGVVPPSLKKRCNDAGGLALAVLRGTLVGSPNVTIRFVLLKLAASTGGGGGGGGGGTTSSSSSGSGVTSSAASTSDPKLGYAVTVPRKESLHEVMLAASKRFHFEEKKAAVFLFRGNAVDGTQNADDLLIVASAVVFVVQRQWWDFQRREEARRGVLTSTKSNDAAVRAMRTNASSKVALTVQQYVTGPQPGVSDLDAANSDDGGSGLGGSGRRSEVSAPRGRQATRSVSPVRGRASPSLESHGPGRETSLPATSNSKNGAINPASPYNMSPRPGGGVGLGGRSLGPGRSLLVIPELNSSPSSKAIKGSASVAISDSLSPRKGVEVPIKFAKAIHATAGRAIDALNLALPELVRAQYLVDQTFPGGLESASQNEEMTEILDLRSLRKVGTIIENTGKEIRALVTSLESVTAKKAVQAQARKFASTKRPPPTQIQSPKGSSSTITTVMESTIQSRSSAKAAVGNMGAKVLQKTANESLKTVKGRASPRILESSPPRILESSSPLISAPQASRLPRPSASRLSPTLGTRPEEERIDRSTESSNILKPAPRASTLNRLNGRQSPIMTSASIQQQPVAAESSPPISLPNESHEFIRGPDIEFAPIANVRLSGAVLSSSSKLKFHKT
jgi:hypothetical protein